jgi:hypothetical protein
MATEHATSEYQRSTIPSPASQILTTETINEEQSDFAWYSTHDLGETFQQTRTRFKELFRESLSDKTIHLTRIKESTSLKRRKIACETKSRLVDAEPHRASKYPWVENYHKQEIEANLRRATLPSIALEHLRPFSVEALDFLWFLHYDLGIPANSFRDTFRPRYFPETVWEAHQADFKRRGITLSRGDTGRSQLRTGPSIMAEAYNEKFRLCDLRPDATQYNWMPDIFKSGMRHPHLRHKAFQQFSKLSDKKRIELMTVQLRGPLRFPGLEDMPESTFHRQCSREQPQKHGASSKPGRKFCTRSCTGCITCKNEGGKCDELQSSGKFFPFLS